MAAIASGFVLIVIAAGIAGSAVAQPDVGAELAQQLAESPGASAPPVASGAVAPWPTRQGKPSRAATLVAPKSLRINAIGVTATVLPTGVDSQTGLVSVPSDVDALGWYRFSQGLAATTGSIVIVGHVDSADQGPGAFVNLGRVSVGDEVTATGTDGRDRVFRVIAREHYLKTSVPLDRIFARAGPPRLTLVTCGGRFDQHSRSYLDNVIVTAVPARLGS